MNPLLSSVNEIGLSVVDVAEGCLRRRYGIFFQYNDMVNKIKKIITDQPY